MKKTIIFFLSVIVAVTSCRKIEVDGNPNNNNNNNNQQDNLVLQGRIDSDRTLESGKTYVLKGKVYVVNGAKLTIQPGVTVKADPNAKGFLCITRGSQILANGTATQPIVFTSGANQPKRGDWGGIVICGRAATNAITNGVNGLGTVEGDVDNAFGDGLYGGADNNDNSGVLKFVRIEYGGYAYLPDKELNGLTLCGVGKATVVENVQVSYANDDSFEWFGGTVDCKYLISYKALDDDFDADNGYNGRVQFGFAFRDSAIADISGSNGFEVDNDANGSNLAPFTAPTFSNFTVIGPRATATSIGNSNYRRGAHLRRNTRISIFNSVFLGWPTGILLDGSTGTPTDLNFYPSSGTPNAFLQNIILAGNTGNLSYTASTSSPTGFTSAAFATAFNGSGQGNRILATNADLGLTNAFDYGTGLNINPNSSSPCLTGASFTNARVNTWFTPTTYVGAAGSNDTWWQGWSRFF